MCAFVQCEDNVQARALNECRLEHVCPPEIPFPCHCFCVRLSHSKDGGDLNRRRQEQDKHSLHFKRDWPECVFVCAHAFFLFHLPGSCSDSFWHLLAFPCSSLNPGGTQKCHCRGKRQMSGMEERQLSAIWILSKSKEALEVALAWIASEGERFPEVPEQRVALA